MKMCAGFVCAIALMANAAAAQSNTEAGIRAVLSGDYKTAVRILQPLAEDAAHPDPVAQFFLALAYDSKPPGGDVRACGLFLRAARQEGPFAGQSTALAFAIRNNELGGDVTNLYCVAEERWQGGPPQSFLLGPDHRIVFTDTSITVTYAGEDQRTSIIMPPGDALKVEYTALDVTRPVTTRRHFFQWFGWMPDTTADPSTWTLDWDLSEVVDDQWISVAFEKNLQVAHGPTRPGSPDVSAFVRLRVNASGEAEYEITAGPAARTAVVPWQGKR
jgi:hypothetical protein